MAASSTITLRIGLKQTVNKWIMFSPNLKVWKAWIFWSVRRAQDQPVWVSCVGKVEQLPWYPNILKTAGDGYCTTTKIYSRKIPEIILKVGHAFPCMSRATEVTSTHQAWRVLKSYQIPIEFLSLKRILKAFRASTLSISATKSAISPATRQPYYQNWKTGSNESESGKVPIKGHLAFDWLTATDKS